MSERDEPGYERVGDLYLPRRELLAAFLGAGTLAIAGCGAGDRSPEQFAKNPSWRQNFAIMRDSGLDTSQWRAKLGPENGGGQQVYTNHVENVAVRGGALVITAHEQSIEGHPFSAARIDTLGHTDFGYGRLVISAKLPEGVGPHSAGWLRRVPRGADDTYGEIDIFEHVGKNGTRVYPNVHTAQSVAQGENGLFNERRGFLVPTAHTAFNDYGMEWTPHGISFTINGKQVGERVTPPKSPTEQTWPFGPDDRYYLILNVAVGDNWGGQNGVDTQSDPWQLAVRDISFYPYVGQR